MKSEETKKFIKKQLEIIIGDNGDGYNAFLIRRLAWIMGMLTDEVIVDEKVSNNLSAEQLPLRAAPFQPECKCKVVRDSDESLTIYHCQYHRSIAYVHDELVSTVEVKHRAKHLDLIIGLLSFISECKKNSLTGRVGIAKDENVGR